MSGCLRGTHDPREDIKFVEEEFDYPVEYYERRRKN